MRSSQLKIAIAILVYKCPCPSPRALKCVSACLMIFAQKLTLLERRVNSSKHRENTQNCIEFCVTNHTDAASQRLSCLVLLLLKRLPGLDPCSLTPELTMCKNPHLLNLIWVKSNIFLEIARTNSWNRNSRKTASHFQGKIRHWGLQSWYITLTLFEWSLMCF